MPKFIFRAIDETTAEIYLYGFIGELMGIGAGEFAEQFQELTKNYKTINVRINSGGGSVFEGIAIYNLIKQSKCEVNIYIDGIAASMASVIAMAGRKIYMSKYARLMVHSPAGVVEGDSATLRDFAGQLDNIEKDMLSIYAARTGMTTAEVKSKYMVRGVNKWFTAREALDAKLCDEIYDGAVVTVPAEAASAKDKEMYEIYSQININQNQEESMKNLAKFIALFAMANITLPSDASEEVIIASLKDLVENNKGLLGRLNAAEAKLKTFEDKAKSDQEKRVTNLVAKAITDGKITAELKDSYTAMATADFDNTEKALNAMKAYTSVHGQIKPGEDAQADEKAKWSYLDWSKKDPKGLAAMKAGEFDKFKTLFKAQYGTEFKG